MPLSFGVVVLSDDILVVVGGESKHTCKVTCLVEMRLGVVRLVFALWCVVVVVVCC